MESHSDGRLESNGHSKPQQQQQHPRQRHQPTTIAAAAGGPVAAVSNSKRFTTHHGAVSKTSYSKHPPGMFCIFLMILFLRM